MEKGFARTAIGRELGDPKSEINFEKPGDRRVLRGVVGSSDRTKGKSVKIPTFGFVVLAETRSDLGDPDRPPGKSCLFLLTA